MSALSQALPNPLVNAPKQAILALICLIGFGLSLFINYPGFMSPDSFHQLIEARNGVYSDWHPPLMALIWHFIDKIVPGSLGMFFLLTALMWFGTFLVTLYWFNREQYTLLSLFPALVIFYPPIFGITGAIWKDNLMWAFLMLSIGTAGSLEPVSRTRRHCTYLKLLIIASLFLLAMLVRHNAGFAAVPIMILSIARSFGCPRLYRIAVLSAVGLLSCVLLEFWAVVTSEYLATYKTNIWASLAIFDVAGIIYRMPDHQQQQLSYTLVPPQLRGGGSLDRLLTTYDPRFVDSLYNEGLAKLRDGRNGVPAAFTGNFNLTRQAKASLIRLWLTSVAHFPLAWLSHRISVFSYLIESPNSMVYMYQDPEDWASKILGHPTPQLNRLQTKVNRFLVHLMPIYRPWIYLVLTGSIIGLCILSLTEERLQIALIATSGLAHELGLFIVALGADYRYSHYMVYTSMLALLLFLKSYLGEGIGERPFDPP